MEPILRSRVAWITVIVLTLAAGDFWGVPLAAQHSAGPTAGTLIVDGGGATDSIVRRFVEIAGGREARIVVFATGPSAIRFGLMNTVLNPDWPRDRQEWGKYEAYLKDWFGVDAVRVLHTRDRGVADADAFVAPLRSATGVYLVAGNAGRYADAYLGTRTQSELRALLNRDGVIFGSSAGAIILGSFAVRGDPDKPLLMAPGRTTGFGFLTNAAINPHVTSARRDAELVNVIDSHPDILGIGMEDDAALLVRKNMFQVLGTGRVAIYDNVRRDRSWYYWLGPGDRFDLSAWTRIGRGAVNERAMFPRLEFRSLVVFAAIGLAAIWPSWRIATKAGYSGLFRIVLCLPVVNWLWLAFTEWPIKREQLRPLDS